MTTRIKLRRDTAANWTSQNPILALGEPGLEIESSMMKFGDGVTTWNNLKYSTGSPTQQEQFVVTIAAGESDFPLVVSSSFDGVNWISPQYANGTNGSGQGDQGFYSPGVPAIGKGKLVYIIHFNSPLQNGLAWTDTIEQAPNRITDQCTFRTPDIHEYPIYWNNINFTGEYFVAVGYYKDGSNVGHPYFAYSANGVNWIPGTIDQTYITGLVTAETGSGDTYANGMQISDVESNGQGWLFTLGWNYGYSSPNNPQPAGGFYVPTLATQLSSSNHISTLPTTQWGYTLWVGSAWLGYDFGTNTVFRNTNTNPGQGSWTTTDLSTIVGNVFGDIYWSANWFESNTHGEAIISSGGNYLYTRDSGVTWHGSTVIAVTDRLSAVGSSGGNATITGASGMDGGNNTRVTITGLPSGTFPSGSYFIANKTDGTASVYSDSAGTQHVATSGTFSTLTKTATGKENTNTAVLNSTTGIVVGMTFATNGNEINGPTLQPWLITAVDTVNNIVTINQTFLTDFSSATWLIGPCITFTDPNLSIDGAVYGQGKWAMVLGGMGPGVAAYGTDLVNWNYTIGIARSTSWQSITSEFAPYFVGINFGAAGVANNILISNNAAWQPGFSSATSAVSGLANSLALGNGLQADLFGFTSNGNGDPIKQQMYFNPDYAWWQIGQSTTGLFWEDPSLASESFIGSYDWNGQGNNPDIVISLYNTTHNTSGNGQAQWIFTLPNNDSSTHTQPSQLIMPYNGSIAVNNDGTALNALSVTYNGGSSSQPVIAIGPKANPTPADGNTIAIGYGAGQGGQSGHAIAIGSRSGRPGQGENAIAIGTCAAGQIGTGGTAQSANSIVINALGINTPLWDAGANTFVVKPIRNNDGAHGLYYNSTTGEITYGSSPVIKAATAYDVSPLTAVTLDDVVCEVNNGVLYVMSVSASNSFQITGTSVINDTVAGISTTAAVTNGGLSTIGGTLAAFGDQISVVLQDTNNHHIYRITAIATPGFAATGNASIIIEKLL